ncbi:gliding motility-associated C-terminal domain-containing protein [Robiginitalea sediminis]|uniref:gliding motility-associated C-terminal domain-containing protein n=1 Tax=Robiginitalea sediminis TaxID=1982593 RepID=UPI000B4B9C0C|nr:gliding motility-associated C-terminal domain-containing protein [Robiginitalea sediminis]
MKQLLPYIILLSLGFAHAQPALQHNGGMQLHGGAQVGLHIPLVNEAPFDQNLGLLGFYGPGALSVSGAFAPAFYDVEIDADSGVDVLVPILVGNNLNFAFGDFRTDRSLKDQYVGLLQNAFAVGQYDFSKVNGFAAYSQQVDMVFPVGDADQLRPLTYQAGNPVPLAKCAYFREDPGNSAIYGFLDPALRPLSIAAISSREFWRLEGSEPGTVTLTWNQDSDMEVIAQELGQVELIGWSKAAGRWLPLGTASRAGDLQDGFALSETIVPDEYEVITFAGLAEPEELFTLPNFYMSPNNDGLNDRLIIEELEASPNNNLRIYDRRGLLVFEQDNYTDQFDGTSNVDGFVFNRDAGLPEGVYFYLVRMLDLGVEYQGFLYLRR